MKENDDNKIRIRHWKEEFTINLKKEWNIDFYNSDCLTDIELVLKNICEYLGIAYYENSFHTLIQVEEIAKARRLKTKQLNIIIRNNTGIKKEIING